jgi:hypothetical protein
MWRSIVPWHPATAWALAASFATFVLTMLAHGFDSGVRGGLAVFVTWAIVRELAPKRALASALAPFAAIAWAIPGETDVLSCVGVLAAARVASRTIGDPPTLLDRALLVGLAAWMSLRPAGLPVALVLAAILFTDHPRARARVSGLAVLAAALLVGATEGTLQLRPGWDDPALPAQVLIALTGAAAAWLLVAPMPHRLRARDDRRRGQLVGERIRIARVATVACVGAAIAWVGLDGAFELSCASAALLAAGLGGARLPAQRVRTRDDAPPAAAATAR